MDTFPPLLFGIFNPISVTDLPIYKIRPAITMLVSSHIPKITESFDCVHAKKKLSKSSYAINAYCPIPMPMPIQGNLRVKDNMLHYWKYSNIQK